MRMYYMKMPSCRYCPPTNKKGVRLKPKKLIQQPSRDLGICAGCFRKLFKEELNGQFWKWHNTFPEAERKAKTYNQFIQYMKQSILAKLSENKNS